ncbi:MAG: hypothetical protein OJF51_002525 [Nitrospira sp.]|jgi:DNA-binding NarL/FixJ family response regulator|nr:MAG: hypothetical protein OJF51_002525 [Nitrospira sp.]
MSAVPDVGIHLDEKDCMIRNLPPVPSITLAIISSQYLVWFGLQKVFEHIETPRIVVHPHRRVTPDLLLAEKRPDMFLLDLETHQDAVGTIRQIRESAPTSKIVVLSGVEDKPCLHEVFAFGIDGVILKIQPPEVVLAVIQALSASTTNCDGADSGTQRAVLPDALTEREREIIRLIRQGFSNKEIASQLSISDSTVRHHLTNIFGKVGVRNRQKLLIHAHRFPSTHV